MLIASGHRFHPRTAHDRDRDRRVAALRAQVASLSEQIQTLEKEQRIQFKRIAEIQAKLDELVRLVKSRLG